MADIESLESAAPDGRLEPIFHAALRDVTRRSDTPQVQARFYPYAGLSSTIRLRKGRLYARVSDVLSQSPAEVLYALACILVAKLYRLKASKEHERVYQQYATSPPVLDATESTRRNRGYKIITSPVGRTYNLDEGFSELNGRYFAGSLERPVLSWSQGKTRRVLGHHDHVHGTITISQTLDSPRVPRFVTEYVLYHEMLHIKHPPRVVGGRTIYHGRAFREDERRFERFEDALKYLEETATPVRRRRRRRRSV